LLVDVHFLLIGSYASVFLITYYSINASGYFSFSHILFYHYFLSVLYFCYMCKCHFEYARARPCAHTQTHTHTPACTLSWHNRGFWWFQRGKVYSYTI